MLSNLLLLQYYDVLILGLLRGATNGLQYSLLQCPGIQCIWIPYRWWFDGLVLLFILY